MLFLRYSICWVSVVVDDGLVLRLLEDGDEMGFEMRLVRGESLDGSV